MAKGSAITRVREYFKSAPLDEVEVVFQLVSKDLAGRKVVTSRPVTPIRKRSRKVVATPAVATTVATSSEQETANG